jgi:hypothetical protein
MLWRLKCQFLAQVSILCSIPFTLLIQTKLTLCFSNKLIFSKAVVSDKCTEFFVSEDSSQLEPDLDSSLTLWLANMQLGTSAQ